MWTFSPEWCTGETSPNLNSRKATAAHLFPFLLQMHVQHKSLPFMWQFWSLGKWTEARNCKLAPCSCWLSLEHGSFGDISRQVSHKELCSPLLSIHECFLEPLGGLSWRGWLGPGHAGVLSRLPSLWVGLRNGPHSEAGYSLTPVAQGKEELGLGLGGPGGTRKEDATDLLSHPFPDTCVTECFHVVCRSGFTRKIRGQDVCSFRRQHPDPALGVEWGAENSPSMFQAQWEEIPGGQVQCKNWSSVIFTARLNIFLKGSRAGESQ